MMLNMEWLEHFLDVQIQIFFVIVMSSGGDFDKTTQTSNRKKENTDIWNLFKNVDGVICDKFVKDQSEDEMVNFIESKFLDKVDTIVTTPGQDSHFEHRKINQLGPALCRRSPISLVEYRTPSTLNDWIPNYFVNIPENEYNQKKSALTKFKISTGCSVF